MKNYYRNETLSGFGFVRRILRQYHPFYIAFKCDHGPFCGYIVQLTGIQWPTYLDMVRVNDAQILLRYIPNHSSIAVDYQNWEDNIKKLNCKIKNEKKKVENKIEKV